MIKSDVKFEEKLTLDSKNDIKNLMNFNASSGRSENSHFHVLVLSKNITIDPKMYRGVMCHNTEEWCKIWKVTDLYFKKWHEEFSEFWHNTWKFQNLHFKWAFFDQSISCFHLKKYTVVRRHYTKDRSKLQGKNDLWLHKWHDEFGEFHQSTQKS